MSILIYKKVVKRPTGITAPGHYSARCFRASGAKIPRQSARNAAFLCIAKRVAASAENSNKISINKIYEEAIVYARANIDIS